MLLSLACGWDTHLFVRDPGAQQTCKSKGHHYHASLGRQQDSVSLTDIVWRCVKFKLVVVRRRGSFLFVIFFHLGCSLAPSM